MSQTVYLRNPHTGAIEELQDPKPAELVPLLAQGYTQTFPQEEKKEG